MNTDTRHHRFGRVALVGRPNVGKSTLLNAILGTKLSIVTPKPQTTRHRILGVETRDDAQIVFIDTPGLHQGGKRALNRQLNRVARQVPEEADLLVHVIDGVRWREEDEAVWQLVSKQPAPCLLVVNKVDKLADKKALLPFAAEVTRERGYAAVHFLAARRGDGVPALLDEIVALLPEGPAEFPPDEFTDRSERFLAAELVREQLMLQLAAELPYAAAVEIEHFEDTPGLTRIGAVIWVEREGQKGIVIGAGGAQLKKIGSAARRTMERVFDRKVFLEVRVRVRESWSDDAAALKQFGYSE
ncbi:GTPase Era [Dokdonella fugitiva]|jgi:GTP-binding protein Era|uniref:GTPase Era n=1 Tax=Dokdonella fugitiva TaxID=328517 RepID=A0A4V2S2F9_9GAMM|nr:GTPase Era [Dokdonella fugitiva]MBA8883233.1 GTP-binding protein Era [Dokdonella fugitiva]TCO40310.1 GTP-binding protein Era [Dokdonella fugitiva]